MKRILLFGSIFFSISSFSQDRDLKLELFFDVNKSAVTTHHLTLIDSMIIRQNLVITVIKGFADSTGSNSSNMDLSRKRAWAVYKYLKEKQSGDSINIEYFGEQHAAGKEMFYNRRVEIYFKRNIVKGKTGVPESNIADTLAITERYELTNIYFIPDKAVVDPVSFFAVDDAANYLKRFPGCKFEIVGHVNYVLPPSVLNNPKALEPAMKLSEERAKTVYDLLAERNIPVESMTFKGVGNSQMVFRNPKNDAEKRKNMRVEILISCTK